MDKLRRKHFYVNISSSDVGSYVGTNTLSDFSSKLSIPLHFPPNEKWTVSLVNMTLPNIEKNNMTQDVVYFSSPKIKSQSKIAKIEANMNKIVKKTTKVNSDEGKQVIQRFQILMRNGADAPNNIPAADEDSDDDEPPAKKPNESLAKKRVVRQAEIHLKNFSNNSLFIDFSLVSRCLPTCLHIIILS